MIKSALLLLVSAIIMGVGFRIGMDIHDAVARGIIRGVAKATAGSGKPS